MKREGTWDRIVLRRIHRAMVEEGIWRIGTKQGLREL
jgi:hypothetical protein